MNYLLHLLILVCIYAMLATSLNLLAGYTGLLSVCHAAFYGIGAYATALLSLKAGFGWFTTVPLGMLVAGTTAAVIGLASLRLRHDYFIMATFAFQVILFSVMQNWVDLTQGPIGLPAIPVPTIGGWRISSQWQFVILSAVSSAVVILAIRQIVSAPYGRVLQAIREDEGFAQALGKNVPVFKVSAFVFAGITASFAGSIYAAYLTYINPSSFTVQDSILILAMVIIGGAARISGSIIGGAILIVLPETLRFVGLPTAVAANLRQIIYGGLLVAMMAIRPRGLVGKYSFGR